jgi:cytochrome P450
MARLPGPGLFGNLAVGLDMVRDAPNTLLDLQRRYGNVVTFGRGPLTYTCLFGPGANRYLLAENPGNFTWREAIQGLIVVDGDTALVVTDGPEHDRRRRLVQPAFATRAIRSYGEVMEDEANRTIDSWRAGDDVDLYDEWRRCIRRIAIRTLFGETLHDRAEEFGDALAVALDYVNQPLSMMVQWHGPAYRRAVKSRDRADAIVNAEIARRRALAAVGRRPARPVASRHRRGRRRCAQRCRSPRSGRLTDRRGIRHDERRHGLAHARVAAQRRRVETRR